MLRTKVIQQRMIKIRSIRNKSLTVCGTATVDRDVHSINLSGICREREVSSTNTKKLSGFTIVNVDTEVKKGPLYMYSSMMLRGCMSSHWHLYRKDSYFAIQLKAITL